MAHFFAKNAELHQSSSDTLYTTTNRTQHVVCIRLWRSIDKLFKASCTTLNVTPVNTNMINLDCSSNNGSNLDLIDSIFQDADDWSFSINGSDRSDPSDFWPLLLSSWRTREQHQPPSWGSRPVTTSYATSRNSASLPPIYAFNHKEVSCCKNIQQHK